MTTTTASATEWVNPIDCRTVPQPAFTVTDPALYNEDLAAAEGWALFYRNCLVPEIDRDDEAEIFESGAAALAHVRAKAAEGSTLHIEALRVHEANDPRVFWDWDYTDLLNGYGRYKGVVPEVRRAMQHGIVFADA